jgi:hypothetical protein
VLLLLLSLFRVNYYTLYVSFLLSFFLFVFIHRTLWFFFALFLFLFLSLSFFFSHFYFEYRWRVTNVSLQSARFQSGEFLKNKKSLKDFSNLRPLDQTNKQRYLLFIIFLGNFILRDASDERGSECRMLLCRKFNHKTSSKVKKNI